LDAGLKAHTTCDRSRCQPRVAASNLRVPGGKTAKSARTGTRPHAWILRGDWCGTTKQWTTGELPTASACATCHDAPPPSRVLRPCAPTHPVGARGSRERCCALGVRCLHSYNSVGRRGEASFAPLRSCEALVTRVQLRGRGALLVVRLRQQVPPRLARLAPWHVLQLELAAERHCRARL